MTPISATVFDALRRALGSNAVDTSAETLVRYARSGSVRSGAPASTGRGSW
jgi:hypothetical protein